MTCSPETTHTKTVATLLSERDVLIKQQQLEAGSMKVAGGLSLLILLAALIIMLVWTTVS